MTTTGYLHWDYSHSLAEFGYPYLLKNSEGWILKRQIPGFNFYDAMGTYPLFCCKNWSKLSTDIEDHTNDLVSLSIVTDPFGNYTLKDLENCFNTIVKPFKTHFVVDLSKNPEKFVSKRHQRSVKKALNLVQVEICEEPQSVLNTWVSLYEDLIERHNILGIRAFSKKSFEKQLAVPGIKVFMAKANQSVVSMLLFFIQDKFVYYHLGASSDEGYSRSASFALFWTAIEFFSNEGYEWLNLGAGAGVEINASDGLTLFKQGWSTGNQIAYFCGHVFDEKKYQKVAAANINSSPDYFPAYRTGEFS